MVKGTLPTLDPWLAHFPEASRVLVAAWFAYAAGQGAQTPEELLAVVTRLVSAKLDWSVVPETRQTCSTTLLALVHRRREALDYARAVLAQQAVR
jgi:hypothetical protein